MMLITQIRLTNYFLGELRPDNRQVRRFKKDRQGRIAINQKSWLEQFDLAARNLQMDVNCFRTIVPPVAILPASVHLYRRCYSKVHVELFEAFRTGTVITFELMLRDDLPKCPNLIQLQSILSFTGERLGLSQFGNKFGFGRFSLHALSRANPEALVPPPVLLPSIAEAPMSLPPLGRDLDAALDRVPDALSAG